MEFIEKFAAEGLELTVDAERPVAMCVRPSPRARLGYKIEFNYVFGSFERMNQYLEEFLAGLERAKKVKEERKIARAAAKVRFATLQPEFHSQEAAARVRQRRFRSKDVAARIPQIPRPGLPWSRFGSHLLAAKVLEREARNASILLSFVWCRALPLGR